MKIHDYDDENEKKSKAGEDDDDDNDNDEDDDNDDDDDDDCYDVLSRGPCGETEYVMVDPITRKVKYYY